MMERRSNDEWSKKLGNQLPNSHLSSGWRKHQGRCVVGAGNCLLTIEQMGVLFQKSRSTINEHILNIYKEGELEKSSTIRKIGNSDFSTKPTNYYNLDVIISVGYRVKSRRGTQFRIWATQRLKEYIIKGFTLNDERFKSGQSMNYFNELQERIREIRLSERFFYQKIKV